jgi:hypothetical protein
MLPTKTRELHNHHFDSTIWADLQFRDDDIIISTYAKSGTTWMQQIVAQMLFGPDPDLEVAEMSPWLDLRVPSKAVKLPIVEAQAHRSGTDILVGLRDAGDSRGVLHCRRHNLCFLVTLTSRATMRREKELK